MHCFSSLPEFLRTTLICSLVAVGLLVVGCDSGGSSGGGGSGETNLESTSSVTVDLSSSSSSSSTNSSASKKNAKASGNLTVGFHYENDSGDDCNLSTTEAVSDTPYNESFNPANISGDCDDPENFDGVQVNFEPGSSSSADGLVLSLTDENGNEIASDNDPSDGIDVSGTVSEEVDLPENIGGDDGSDDDANTPDFTGKWKIISSTNSNFDPEEDDIFYSITTERLDVIYGEVFGETYCETNEIANIDGNAVTFESSSEATLTVSDGGNTLEVNWESGDVWTAEAVDRVPDCGDDDDTTAPNAPSNLSGSAGDGSVDLNWDAVSADDLAGYNVYRSTSSISDVSGMEPINESLLSSASYTDNEVSNGTTYYYVVTAVDNSDNESSVSNEVSKSPSSSDDGTEKLVPVESGNEWEAKVENNNDFEAITLEATSQTQIELFDGDGNNLGTVKISQDSDGLVIESFEGENDTETDIIRLKYPAADGDSYEYTDGDGTTRTVSVSRTTVTVPAGTFEDCLQYKFDGNNPVTFKPGVGPVQWETGGDDGVTYKLNSTNLTK